MDDGEVRPARSARLPQPGSASSTRIRSPRTCASIVPQVTVVVVLPTPPLRPSIPIWYEPRAWRQTRVRSSSSYFSSGDRPKLMRVNLYTARRQPRCGTGFAGLLVAVLGGATAGAWTAGGWAGPGSDGGGPGVGALGGGAAE